MLPLIMAVCGAAGAVAGVVTTQAANEKNKQAVKRYEKVNSELINKQNELKKRYHELSDNNKSNKRHIDDLNLKLAESEMEKDLVYLALNLYHELMALREDIDINPSLVVLKDFHKAIALTNYVLKQLDKQLVPISQNYFSRTLQRIDERDNLTKESLLDFITVLMNPEEEILTSFVNELQNDIVNQEHLELEEPSEEDNQKIIETEATESEKELNKNNAEYWIQQGKEFGESEEYDKALVSFEKACAIDSNNDEIWSYLSFCFYKLNRKKESIDAINKAITINPNEDKYWYVKGSFLSDMGMNEEALKAINTALEINPDEGDYWYHQSTIFRANSDRPKAMTSIRKAIKISPDNDEYWNHQGIILLDKNLYKHACSAFEKSIELNPIETLYWINKAIALYLLNQNDKALESINQAIEINSNNDETWYWRGRILFKMTVMLFLDRKEEALQAFKKAIALAPNNDEYWYWKSRCLVNLCKEKEALIALKKAIELDPNNDKYWYWKSRFK